MSADQQVPLYDQHVQCLLAHLGECELGPADIASGGPGGRQEAESFVASFVRLDEPDNPQRFRRVAGRLVAFMARWAGQARGGAQANEWAQYEALKRGMSDILIEELGPPKGRYYE